MILKLFLKPLWKKNGEEWRADSFADENSLILKMGQGLTILLGCAHRGLVNILEYVKTHFQESIFSVIGGTHLSRASESHLNFVKEYLRKEDIQIFAPGHCTGIRTIIDFQRDFPHITRPAFCGSVFEI